MAKIDAVVLLSVAVLVLVAGCEQPPTTTKPTPATCGDGICGVGETSANCPQDCGEMPTGRPSVARRMSAPELEVAIDKTAIPSKMQPNEQAIILVRLKNVAKMSMDEEENERLTIRNVKVLFYDFGDFTGCTPSDFDFERIGPEEEREVTCSVIAPSFPVEQTIRVRTYYTYDLYLNLGGIQVLSKDEYMRERPTTKKITTEVRGPMSMQLAASLVPVQAGRTLNVAVNLEEESGRGLGVLQKEEFGVKYQVELLQVRVPREFTVSYPGQLTPTGTGSLTAEMIPLVGGQRTISFTLTAPDLDVPRETYSISAVATGFDVFQDESVDLNVVEWE